MRAVGEVMSVGRLTKRLSRRQSEALKLVRYGLGFAKDFNAKTKEDLLKLLITPSSERHFIMYEALRKGATVDEII